MIFSSCTNERAKQSKHKHTWTVPSEDELKLNIDGSFCPVNRKGGWGFILRNTNGEAVGAGAGALQYVYDAL
jgi:hypothetical protein